MKLLQKFGKTKGFIFSMDALVGLMIVIMVLTVANIFISRIEYSSLAELQMIKRSNDLFKIIDEMPIDRVESGSPPKYFDVAGVDYLIQGRVILDNNENINPYINKIIHMARGTEVAPPNPTIDLRIAINATCKRHNSDPNQPLIDAWDYSSLPLNFILPKDRFVSASQRIIVIPNRVNPTQTWYCLGDFRSWLP